MDELIQKLSEIRGIYNCLDEYDEPYYRALSEAISIIDRMERNNEIILQAGKEGREIELHIGGRLFAIREKDYYEQER